MSIKPAAAHVAQNFGTISNSSASESVTSSADGTYAGGLVGDNYGTAVSPLIQGSSFSAGTVTASSHGHDIAGGLVGENNGGTIQNSNSSGTVTCLSTTGDQIGGLVGENNTAPGHSSVLGYILSSHSSASVGSSSYCAVAGGLVGTNGSVIGQTSTGAPAVSYATGTVTVGDSIGSVAGGLAGYNNDIVAYSYATGNVSGHGFIGGLVGKNGNSSTGSVSQSFAKGDVSDSGGSENSLYSYGGLIGVNAKYGTIDNSYAKGDVTSACTNCNIGGFVGQNTQPNSGSTNLGYAYEIGNVTATGTGTSFCAGGFVGSNDVGTETPVTTAYWNTQTNSQTSGYGTNAGCSSNGTGITGVTTAQLQTSLTILGFSSLIWGLSPTMNGGYPYLLNNLP